MELKQLFLNGISIQELAEAIAPLLQTTNTNSVVAKEPEFLNRREVCELLHISPMTLHNYTKQGKLKKHGIGDRVLYKRSEVVEAIKPIS